MSRIFLDDLRAATTALFADNTTGDISPADLRGVMLDTIDSTVQDECNLAATAPTLALATTASFVPLSVYGEDNGGDGVFLTPDFVSGTITTAAEAGFTYTINCNATIESLQNSVPCEFVVLENGIPDGLAFALTGDGKDDPVSIAIRHLINAAPASAVYSIGIRTPDGASTLDVMAIEVIAVIHPTNNP